MQIEVLKGSVLETLCDALIINLFEGILSPGGATGTVDKALDGQISEIIRNQPDCGKYGETTTLYTSGSLGAKQVILLGLGRKDELTLEKIRSLAAIAIRYVRKGRCHSVASITHGAGIGGFNPEDALQAVIEGTLLGNYQFNNYKTEKNNHHLIEKFIIIENDPDKCILFEKIAKKAKIIAESVNFARDLVNHPACYMNPTKMANEAAEIAKQTGLELTVLDTAAMKEQQMNALLAVAQGSNESPKMIVLKYIADKTSDDLVAYVGKGITFDSGGISLKPSENMWQMKGDMAGGAAVLGAMMAIAQLKPRINIISIIPCAENMPSGHALKPGDVISSMSGKTIEIISTDAEGRLLLADAITYAKKLGATKLVDIATLTGACVVALGNVASGVITNESTWCQQLLTAAEQCGEKMWQLPAFDEYKEQIKSDIADLKNSGGRMAGAITAGLFIEKFVGKTPWVHIDIAGTSDSNTNKGYNIKGATGAGVRTLVQLALNIG